MQASPGSALDVISQVEHEENEGDYEDFLSNSSAPYDSNNDDAAADDRGSVDHFSNIKAQLVREAN